MAEVRGLYPLLVNGIDGTINWHLKEQLAIGEKEVLNLLP
tara:strand:+ start:299 stop:418 length:120 start_codon:yes stop_codon:yes gene_type:complete